MALDSLQQALALIRAEQFFEAIPLLDSVIAEQAAEPLRQVEVRQVEAYLARARIRRRLKDEKGAIADYTQAIKLKPTAETYLARALVWLSLKEPKGAIADSREAITLKPALAGGHRLLGKALGLLGDGVGAIAAYKQAARCYLDAKDKVNAQACLEAIEPLKVLPPYPRTEPSTQALGFKTRATPEDYIQRVQQKYDSGEYAAALKDLDWLLGVSPNEVKALCLRGLIQAQLGRREQAIADLAKAKQASPEDLEVRLYRGQMRLVLKDGYGAIEELSALISAAEKTDVDAAVKARYFALRGDGYRQVGELENAFKDYSNAIAIDTENATLYERRAHIQQEMGGAEGAIEDYQRAATLWLDTGDWKKHQQVVESVRRLKDQKSSGSSRDRKGATVSIKRYKNHLPVVDVLFDGVATFDMVIDRNAPNSIVTKTMANRLNLELVSYRYVYLADGTPMELSIARLRSVVIGGVIITDVYVAVAPDNATAVLGKDCFGRYSIRISGNEITFVR